MKSQSVPLFLISAAATFGLGAAIFCATVNPKDASKGAGISIFLAATVLPALCIVGAAKAAD
jgi:hypothetical protein